MASKIVTHAIYNEIVSSSVRTLQEPLGRANSTTLAFRMTNDRAAKFRRRAARLGFASPSHALRALADAATSGDPETIARLTKILGLGDGAEADAIVAAVQKLLGVDASDDDGSVPGDSAAAEVAAPVQMQLYPGGAKGPGQKLSDATARLLGTTPAKWDAIKASAVTRTPAAPTRPAPAPTKLSGAEIAGCKRLGISEAEFQARKRSMRNRA
jgi:hypothetical protein